MKISTVILFVFLFLLSLSCKKEPPTNSPSLTTCDYLPGNRSFTWLLDTVAWFPSTLGGVWAFSDTDAYAIGAIVDGKPPYTVRVGRHWNGKVWGDSINGTWGYNNATGIWGDITIDPRNDVTGDDHFMVAVGFWGIGQTEYGGVAEFDNRTKKWKSYQLQSSVGELRSVWTDGKGFFITVGDNGMVYTKDGYTAQWVYQKAPTEFNLNRLAGISRDEIYTSGYLYLSTGASYQQGWKLYNTSWTKLFDTRDTSSAALSIVGSDYPGEMGVWRCGITDSLKLYVIGDQSYLFESIGQQLNFRKTNLTDLGLPLKADGRTGQRVDIFTPNDIWIIGTGYNFYQWNGSNFSRINVSGLPMDDTQFGWQLKLIKTESGKIFFGSEVSPQVYIVVRGIP